MKKPREIAARMQRQWQRKFFRLEMLTTGDTWPRRYTIGVPAASDLTTTPTVIRDHVALWRQVSVGEVLWREVNYRASSEPVRVPSHWILERPSDWVRAAADRQVAADFAMLEFLIGQAASELHEALITSLKQMQGRSREELLAAVVLASTLKPGEAQGRPLRLLAGHGVDTKFFERNRQLLVQLLDARYEGSVSEQGLHAFLDATPDGEHWLLVVPLQRGLLPFEVQQVRAQELATMTSGLIQASRILVVENRQCRYLLPQLDNTVAILGSGLDLDWLSARWLDGRHIAYWGDIDTWGLTMLARARLHRAQLTAVLMDRKTFEQHAVANAVVESVGAGDELPLALKADELALYRWLLTLERGRLEQEYLPAGVVRGVLEGWAALVK